MKPAGFWIRFFATLIDTVIWGIAMTVLGKVLNPILGIADLSPQQQEELQKLAATGGDPSAVLAKTFELYLENGIFVGTATTMLLALTVTVAFIVVKGGTPGKLALGLRIVLAGTKRNPGVFKALLREVPGRILSSLMFVGYFFVIFRTDKRALHDLIAGTQVVRKPSDNL